MVAAARCAEIVLSGSFVVTTSKDFDSLCDFPVVRCGCGGPDCAR